MIIDQATELRQLVRQGRENQPASDAHGAQLLLVTAGKQGVGATSAAVHLAMALQAAGQQTLLVDANPENAGATAMCRVEPHHSLSDILAGRRKCLETILPGPGNLHVLPGGAAGGNQHFWTEPAQLRLMADLRAGDLNYGAVVIDGGSFPQNSCLLQNTVRRFWQAADAVVVVTNPDVSAVMDAYAAVKLMAEANAHAPIWTFVSQAGSGDIARDVHGRLSRACQRFLEMTIADGGWLPALPSYQPFAETTRLYLAPLVEALRALRRSTLTDRQP